MDFKTFSSDETFRCQWGSISINATIIYTWIVMALMTVGSWLVTRNLSSGKRMSRWQNLLEVIVGTINDQIREVGRQKPEPYLPSWTGRGYRWMMLGSSRSTRHLLLRRWPWAGSWRRSAGTGTR